ncbi:hypothetical protein ABZ383_23290 [Streptomyces sp. NPDC005900]|uniref:hypothetical protein n=1 Tax=Streptomyces sp. NPDC005900 TaxID=3154569 RepID=UPI003401BF7D
MSGQGPSGGRDIEDTWRQPWWIVVGGAVMFGMAWAVVGFWIDPATVGISDDCVRGRHGGCLTDTFHWTSAVAFFLLGVPTMVVVIMGLVTDRWPPAVGVALGAVGGGILTLSHGGSTPHVSCAVVEFGLAAVALALTGSRKLRSAYRRSREDWLRQ